ncbi:MAG: divergent PAP2 family protein [Anaerolineae bacterium]|nr:divergent PAP2 family protein [Anaerolineae bacterium]
MLLSLLRDLINNDVMWVSIAASTLAQFLKPFTYLWKTKEFDWHHIAATGGMPSSHSALVTALATGLGLEFGFDSPFFAMAIMLTMIVTYDAQGVRKQAGEHGRAINQIIAELLSGQEIGEKEFQEVLGHSRMEVAAGVLFGIGVMLVWKFLVQPLFT